MEQTVLFFFVGFMSTYGNPVLYTEGTVTRGQSTYINCSVDASSTSISLQRPDGNTTVIMCSNTKDCKQQLAGYTHDQVLSNNTMLVVGRINVDFLDNGKWTCTCKSGSKSVYAVANLTVTEQNSDKCTTECPPPTTSPRCSEGSRRTYRLANFALTLIVSIINLL